MSEGIWIKQINITNLGASVIGNNSIIALQLTLINPLFSIDFDNNSIDFYVANSADNYVSMGTISLIHIFNGLSKINIGIISNINTSQTSSIANTNNKITISFSLPFPIVNGSIIIIFIPKNSY